MERLLVISDARELAAPLVVALERAGLDNVFTCEGAEEGLRLLARRKPKLVLLAVEMEGLDGFQICRLLKSPAYRDLNDVPVLLFSSSLHDSRAELLGLDAGAFAVLEIPRDLERLGPIAHAALAAKANAAPRTPAAPRVLVVDTDERATSLLREALEGQGLQVELVDDAIAAESTIADEEPDLVVVARSLPVIRGTELLHWIRRDYPTLPVVMLDEANESATLADVLRAGADDCLRKPLDAEEVVSVCRRAMLRSEYKKIAARIVRSEHRLRISEDRYRRQTGVLTSLMESSGDGILVCDRDLLITNLNPAASRIFGIDREGMLGIAVDDLLGEGVHEKLAGMLDHPTGPTTSSFEHSHEAGESSKVLSIGVSKCLGDGGSDPALLLIVRDMTVERQIQDRLAQSQKMESLGALAGGMAHDFNNILATILPHAEMIRELSADSEEVVERARTIEWAARRGGELTRRLLSFARPESRSTGEADPNASVESAVALLRETLDRNIRIELELTAESLASPIDSGQLEHVLLNMGINARDAMPEGGVLTLRTALVSPEELSAEREEGPFVAISIEDTGQGMSPEVRRHIFDPFFTTKGEGKGTGLGLSTAYNIVRTAGGFIEVESRPGQGTRFRILLPARPVARVEPEVVTEAIRGQRERILVVDDEEPVRRLTTEMLGRLNYEVLSAGSGAEAIELCGKAELDLVLLDMVMPEMDGRTTYYKLREMRPNTAFLVTSGDPEGPRSMELADRGVERLQKPFSLADLSHKVQSVLRERTGAESVPVSLAMG